MNCLFCEIIAEGVPAHEFYEDEEVVVFHDIGPQAPVHFLVTLKRHIPILGYLTKVDRPLTGHILFIVQRLVREQSYREDFRVVMNCDGPDGQIMHYTHMHMLGQRRIH